MLTAVVVLPTPPFWFAIAYTEPIRRPTLPIAHDGPRASTRRAERALLRHSRAARQVRRGGAALSDHVEVAVARARVGAHAAGSRRAPSRGALAARSSSRLLVGAAPALPGDQHAALDQQRRGELGERREAPDGARGRPRSMSLAPARSAAGSSPRPRRARRPPARWRSRRARSPGAMNSHLRPIDSIRSHLAPRAGPTASARPGKPAPGPDVGDPSAPRAAPSTSSPLSESATWTRQARSAGP